MPAITAIMIFLIIIGISATISNVSARETAKAIGLRGNLLIPGINPLLPIPYTLVALIISVFVHEAGHGIVARVYGIKVESTGIAFVLIIPVGAFVNLDKDGLTNATLKEKSAVLTAGPLNNMILTVISLALLFMVLSTLTPIPTQVVQKSGLEIISVTEGSLAKKIGLTQGSNIMSIGQTEILTQNDLLKTLRSNIGKQPQIIWQDRDGNQKVDTLSIPADTDPNKPILGVSTIIASDPALALESYKKYFYSPIPFLPMPTLHQSVPFSEEMAPKYESYIFGPSFAIFANTLFWLWFINLNLGLFNSLPIAFLDGGQLYGSLIESRSKIDKNRLKNISSAVSTITIIIVAMSIFLPYLLS
ncbi:MAG TPA: M50 family metallopeptidase [Nitrososphaeraceae archaeon]|jgi:membrane-associated protease RseP (regulator of RpoE activity)